MTQVEEQSEVEIVKGYTMTQFCDKMIDLFLNEKTKSKEWRKYLVFRNEWKKYRDSFFVRCQRRADMENDTTMKEKFTSLGRRVKKVTYYQILSLCNVDFRRIFCYQMNVGKAYKPLFPLICFIIVICQLVQFFFF